MDAAVCREEDMPIEWDGEMRTLTYFWNAGLLKIALANDVDVLEQLSMHSTNPIQSIDQST